MNYRNVLIFVTSQLALLAGSAAAGDDRPTQDPSKQLVLQARSLVEEVKGSGEFREERRTVRWEADKTAVIVCDMWDDHTCQAAAARVAEMAPAADRTIKAARERGVLIIHAPSGRTAFYANTPARRRAVEAPLVEPPVPIGTQTWNSKRERGGYDFMLGGGCGCDKPCAGWVPDERGIRRWKGEKAPWTRQIKTIEITDQDAVTADGQEIYNLLRRHSIHNVIILGVHTNQCVIGRPFGIRQMVYLGKNVVLCRDLTDALFQPRSADFDHFRGNDRVIEHIEKYWCATITSASLTGEAPFRFKEDSANEPGASSIRKFSSSKLGRFKHQPERVSVRFP